MCRRFCHCAAVGPTIELWVVTKGGVRLGMDAVLLLRRLQSMPNTRVKALMYIKSSAAPYSPWHDCCSQGLMLPQTLPQCAACRACMHAFCDGDSKKHGNNKANVASHCLQALPMQDPFVLVNPTSQLLSTPVNISAVPPGKPLVTKCGHWQTAVAHTFKAICVMCLRIPAVSCSVSYRGTVLPWES